MSLGPKKDAGNNFLPAIKYNAKEGTFICPTRTYEDGQWIPKERDVTKTFEAITDLQHMRIGWIKIQKGVAPDTVLVPVGTDPGDPPDRDFKLGIRLVMLMSEACGDDLREMLNTSTALWDAVSELHDKFLAGAPHHVGELPVVKLASMVVRPSS
jgi:hypothetical protein